MSIVEHDHDGKHQNCYDERIDSSQAQAGKIIVSVPQDPPEITASVAPALLRLLLAIDAKTLQEKRSLEENET